MKAPIIDALFILSFSFLVIFFGCFVLQRCDAIDQEECLNNIATQNLGGTFYCYQGDMLRRKE